MQDSNSWEIIFVVITLYWKGSLTKDGLKNVDMKSLPKCSHRSSRTKRKKKNFYNVFRYSLALSTLKISSKLN